MKVRLLSNSTVTDLSYAPNTRITGDSTLVSIDKTIVFNMRVKNYAWSMHNIWDDKMMNITITKKAIKPYINNSSSGINFYSVFDTTKAIH